MKRSRELELILRALETGECTITAKTVMAVKNGLRSIRREKHEERARRTLMKAKAITSDRIADYGPTAEKLGDPAASGNRIADRAVTTDMLADDPQPISDAEQRFLENRFPQFQDPGKHFEVRRTP